MFLIVYTENGIAERVWVYDTEEKTEEKFFELFKENYDFDEVEPDAKITFEEAWNDRSFMYFDKYCIQCVYSIIEIPFSEMEKILKKGN